MGHLYNETLGHLYSEALGLLYRETLGHLHSEALGHLYNQTLGHLYLTPGSLTTTFWKVLKECSNCRRRKGGSRDGHDEGVYVALGVMIRGIAPST